MAKKRKRVRPADVIDGRVKPGPRALVSLIAEVNPTGRGLSPAEKTRRYAEKSALQSLLLRWYGDAFFAETTEVDDIVLLRHRHFDECACHAQISGLDDAARAWVWRNLDDHPESELHEREPDGAPASDEASGNPALLLAKAQAALAAYDYEKAEHLFVAAFEATAGSAPSSRALLELYVDVLGQDARALELEARLSRAARNDPPVRSLIGLAAARSGDAARAIELVRDVTHPRVGEVYATAGRAALRSGKVDEARACAAQARSLGATSEAASLEAAIEEALRKRAQVEEAKLDALIAAGDEQGAEAFARELLSAGVPSARAKRFLREVAERRAALTQAELSRKAREAIDAGKWNAARRALRELARMGRADSGLEAALEKAERAAEEAREAALVREVLEALTRAPDEGLALYLAQGDGVRTRVKAKGPTALCERAEAIWGALKRPRPEEVASAVLHIEALERALDANDLDQALAHVEPLSREVERLPDVRPLVDRVLGMLGRRHAHEAKAHIDAAVRALSELQWERVLEEVRAIPTMHLSYMREGAKIVRWLAETAERGRNFEAQAARACEPDADLEALHEGHTALLALRQYVVDSHQADAREMSDRVRERMREWEERLQNLDRAKTAALRFAEHPVPKGTRADIEDEGELGARAPDVRIDDELNIWLIASPEERCYLTEASIPDLAVKRRFSFTVPGGRRARTVIPVGTCLWIPLSDGGMLVLDRKTPSRVLDVWWGAGLKESASCETWAEIAPDASAMVLRTPKRKSGSDLVLRAYRTGATRPLPNCVSVCFFGRPGRGRVLVTGGKRHAWQVYETETLSPVGGVGSFREPLADFLPIAAVDMPTQDGDDPSETGHVFLAIDTATMDGGERDEPSAAAIHLVRVSANLEPIQHTLVTAACTGLCTWLYRFADRLMVVYYDGAFPTVELFDPWSLESEGTLPLFPGLQVPVTDAGQRYTLLLERDHLSFHVPKVPAGASLDSLTDDDSLPFVSGVLSPRSMCAHQPDTWARRLFATQCNPLMLKSVSNRFRRDGLLAAAAEGTRVFDRMAAHVAETTPETVLTMFWRKPAEDANERLFLLGAEHAVSLCPEDPTVVEWLELALEKTDLPAVRAHLLHLLGLTHLAAGRRKQAVASWLRGARIDEDHCPFRLLVSITGGLTRKELEELYTDIPLPAFVWGHAQRYERAVLAMGRLDAAIEAGRGEDAWREARKVRELVGPSWQLSARVALLHLDHPRADTDPWRYQLDLAWVASRAWLGSMRNHMIFAGHHWDHQRLTEISKRAAEVLDALGVGPTRRTSRAELETEAQADRSWLADEDSSVN